MRVERQLEAAMSKFMQKKTRLVETAETPHDKYSRGENIPKQENNREDPHTMGELKEFGSLWEGRYNGRVCDQ